MIDVHCHLQFHSFKDDYDVVAKQAFQAGVTKIINTGTKLDSSQKAIALADKYKDMYAIIGVHPHHADKTEDSWIKKLQDLALNPKVVGIGEVGLDFFSYKSNGIVDPGIQKKVFESQIELSHRLGLPLQIHNRHAGEDVIEILYHHKNLLQDVPGMFHCFAGSLEVLKKALDLGFFIGFDGNLTYEGLAPGESTDLKELAKYVPLDRIVVETDSPYLSPVPYRGTRNVPANVIITAKFLSKLKGFSYSLFVDQTNKNVYNIFKRLQ